MIKSNFLNLVERRVLLTKKKKKKVERHERMGAFLRVMLWGNEKREL